MYYYSAKLAKDQPCGLTSKDFTEFNYAAIVYAKTAILFDYLMNFVGEGAFDEGMRFYFENYKFKHPQPLDLKKVLAYYGEKDLSWLFDDMIGTTKKLDYKICGFKKTEGGTYDVVIKNNSNVKGPIAVCGIKNGKIRGMVWYEGFEGEKTLQFPPAEIDEFKIDYFGFMPEINRQNNTIRIKGIFKKIEPIKLEFIGAIDNPNKTQLFWTPIAGYNEYNKGMLGLAVYNHALFQKKIEIDLAPLYSFGSNNICGYGKIQGNIALDNNFIQQISLGVKSSRFAYATNEKVKDPLNFTKIEPYPNIEFGKKNKRSPITQHIAYRMVNISRDSKDPYGIIYTASPSVYSINDLRYTLENKRTINPFKIMVNAQVGNGMSKASVTANFSISTKPKKSIDIRFFAGKMFGISSNGDYRFRMSGQTGFQDYLYDNIYFGRSTLSPSNIGFQQFSENDGAFKVWCLNGQSDNWLSTVNIKSPKLFKLPLLAYADFGVFSTNVTNIINGVVTGPKPSDSELMYSFGVGIPLIKNAFEIYIPLYNSKNINDGLKNFSFAETIRFTLNLNMANPFNIIKNVMPL